MRKIVKKYGEAFVITFTKEERETLNLKKGDILEIDFKKVDSEIEVGNNV